MDSARTRKRRGGTYSPGTLENVEVNIEFRNLLKNAHERVGLGEHTGESGVPGTKAMLAIASYWCFDRV